MDPEAPAPEQAAPDTPTTADTQAEIDWRKRYEDLQPEYTRKSQSAAEFERLRSGQNPEALKEILDAYGYELADDDEIDPDPDPEPPAATKPDPRIDEVLKWQQEIQAERAETAFNSDLKKAAGDRSIPDQGRDWILQRTISNGGDYQALEQATKDWVAFEDSLITAAQQRKQRPRAPHVPPTGTPAPEGKDPADMSLSELNRFAMDRLNAETA